MENELDEGRSQDLELIVEKILRSRNRPRFFLGSFGELLEALGKKRIKLSELPYKRRYTVDGLEKAITNLIKAGKLKIRIKSSGTFNKQFCIELIKE